MTGVGFFVDILIPADVTRPVERPSLILSDVNGTAANVKNGMGFLLYVTDGAISMLEGYTFDEPWPLEVDGLVLAYSSGKNRDLDNVRRIIQKAALHS